MSQSNIDEAETLARSHPQMAIALALIDIGRTLRAIEGVMDARRIADGITL